MLSEQPSIPPRFRAGTVLEGRLSSAIVLEAHEAASLAILLLLPSGYRVITKFQQLDAWEPVPPLSQGWRIERLNADTDDADWGAHLPDIAYIVAILNDHNWHGGEAPYRYRVVPPDNASDEEMTHIEELGGFF